MRSEVRGKGWGWGGCIGGWKFRRLKYRHSSLENWLPGLVSGQCGHQKQMGKGISLQMSGSP